MSITKGVVLVTGSAPGIGRSIALCLARDGFDIAVIALPSKHDELRTIASEIENMGRRTHLVPTNMSTEDDVKRMVCSVVEELAAEGWML